MQNLIPEVLVTRTSVDLQKSRKTSFFLWQISGNCADVSAVYDTQARESLVELRADACDAARKLPTGVRPRRHPDVTGVGAHTTLHHLTTTTVSDEHCITRATLPLNAGASLCKRSVVQIDAARLGLPLGAPRSRRTVSRTRRRPTRTGRRAVGDSFGVGHEVRAPSDCEVGAFARREVKVQIPSPVAFTTNDGT